MVPRGDHTRRMRPLAAVYVALLLVVVVLADAGLLGPALRAVHDVPWLDKLVHFVLAFGLGSVLEAATRSRGRAVLVAALAVLAEELSQLAVPGRTFDRLDLAADATGLALGALAVLARSSRSPRAYARRT